MGLDVPRASPESQVYIKEIVLKNSQRRMRSQVTFRWSAGRWVRYWLILAALLSTIDAALALDPHKATTQYLHTVWGADSGISDGNAMIILQSRNGYLWLGTFDGLFRFDGVTFTLLDKKNAPGMKQAAGIGIRSLSEGKDGSLWIGTNGHGLVRMKDGNFTIYTSKDGLSSDTVEAIAEGRDGSLWVGTELGLNRFHDGKFTVYGTADGLSSNSVRCLYVDRSGTLWVGSPGGLDLFKDGSFTSFPLNRPVGEKEQRRINAIRESRDRALWVGVQGGGLVRIKDGYQTVFSTHNGLSSNYVESILEDRDGNLWVGTREGLDRFTDGRLSSYTVKDGLSGNTVFGMAEDREGNLWVGVDSTNPLNQFRDGKFLTYTTQEGLAGDIAYSVWQGRNGTIWVGTRGGLSELHDGRFTVYANKLPSNVIASVLESRDGSLWIGTEGGGLGHLKNGRLTMYTKDNGLADNTVWCLAEGKEGSIWIGSNGGLNRFQNEKLTTYTLNDGLASPRVRTLGIDQDGNLWIGGNGGLTRFRDGMFKTYTKKDGLSSNSPRAVYADQQGVLWVGTMGGGLNRFKDDHFTAITTQQGLIEDNVLDVHEDDRGYLWLSGRKGISRVRKNELEDYIAGRAGSVNPTTYGREDSVLGMFSGTAPNVWKAKDGKLWVPTLRGVVVIDPDHIPTNELAPPVVIEQAVMNGKRITVDQPGLLPPGKGELEFHYAALSFSAPEKVQFKYKLEGFDQNWIDAGTRRTAYYTNISPGKYRFRVIACNNDGVWNEAGTAFSFQLQPHFYQTGWFYGLGLVTMVLAAVGGVNVRMRQMRDRAKLLEQGIHERTAELRLAEEKYRGIFQEAIVGIFQTTPEGQCLSVNSTMARMRGYDSPEELMASADLEQNVYVDPARREEFKRLLEHHDVVENFEYEAYRKDGSRVWFSENARAVRDARGAVLYYVGAVEDITQRKRGEEKLRLEIMERKRAEEAAKASERAAKESEEAANAANQAKSTFLAAMSHEIRTPMNGIMGMTELALDEEISTVVREYLGMTKLSAESLLEIINDILDFSKIEAGKVTLDPIPFDLHKNLGDALKTVALRADQKCLELVCDIAPDVPADIVSDPTRVRQIILNLLSNAIKFTERGEVVLKVSCEPQAESSHSDNGGIGREQNGSLMLHFSVTDTGIGIAPEHQRLVFEAFTQADASTTRKFGGTGLGLAICTKLVELFGGRIWVESEVGKGSTFHFTARVGLTEAPVERRMPIDKSGLLGLPVLVVDDNATNRRVLQETLQKWGILPTLADGALQALAVLHEAHRTGIPFRLVLTDAHMPEVDGFTLAERIKQSPEVSQETIVIMLTSGGTAGDGARCREIGISAYLPKPVRQSELLDAILLAIGQAKEVKPALITRHSLLESQRKLRILLAEDNIVNQTLAIRLLEKQGHQVTVANNGREALQALEGSAAGGFHVVLMDVQMPEMDGFEAAAAIRNKEKGTENHQFIIAMTAYAMKGDRERCLEAGMDGYLPKPITPPELYAALAQVESSTGSAVIENQ
jgi:PAS domain S-box-containing protein